MSSFLRDVKKMTSMIRKKIIVMRDVVLAVFNFMEDLNLLHEMVPKMLRLDSCFADESPPSSHETSMLRDFDSMTRFSPNREKAALIQEPDGMMGNNGSSTKNIRGNAIMNSDHRFLNTKKTQAVRALETMTAPKDCSLSVDLGNGQCELTEAQSITERTYVNATHVVGFPGSGK